MLKIKLFQIFYSDKTQHENDVGFLGLDNIENLRPDWREYWPIRNFLLTNSLDTDTYYSFFSPKFKEKTNLSSIEVHNFISKNKESFDIFIFSPYFDQGAFFLNVFEQGTISHSGIMPIFQDCVKLIFPSIDLNTLVMDSRNITFCNFIVAKPAFWLVWLEVCEKIYSIAESGQTKLSISLNANINYSISSAPVKVFVIERIASLLLCTQSNWKVKSYDSTTLPLSNVSINQFPSDLIMLDALKIASSTQGYPAYLNEFSKLRQSIISKLKK